LNLHLREFGQGVIRHVVPGEIELAKSPARKSASKTRKRALVPVEHRKPTMSDVARLAGVGTMTVSRVLSGTVRVSAETTQRVQTAIEQFNYRPNVLARAFRGQRSHSIGLILPYLYDPFFANCAHAVTTVAKEHGYSVIITTSDEDPETEYTEADEMLQRHVDGLMVIPARSANHASPAHLFGKTPVVAFDRPVPDPSIDTVLVQNTIGSRRITEHLIEHGHKRITFMALSRSLFTISTRFARLSPRHAGCGLRSLSDLRLRFGRRYPEQVLKEKLDGTTPPTAVITSNTLVTRYVLGAISRLGLRRSQRSRLRRLRRLRSCRIHLTAAHGRSPARAGDGPRRGKSALRSHRARRNAADRQPNRSSRRDRVAPFVRLQTPHCRRHSLKAISEELRIS
jgi:LacI family transcriptional regulator